MWVYFVEEIPFKIVWSAVGKTIKVFVTMVEDGSPGYKTTNLLYVYVLIWIRKLFEIGFGQKGSVCVKYNKVG